MNNDLKIALIVIAVMIPLSVPINAMLTSLVGFIISRPVIEPAEKPTLPAIISLNMSNGTRIICNIDMDDNIVCKNIPDNNIQQHKIMINNKKPNPEDMGEVGEAVNTNDNGLSTELNSGIEKPVVKRAYWGTNGTIGPYGISPDGTPLFDNSIYSAAQIAELQGGYGKGYGVVNTPIIINVKDPDDPCSHIHSAVCGVEAPMGCSGDPNPPTEMDIWKFNHGVFTPRQGDIMLGGCYNNLNNNSNNNLNNNNLTLVVTDNNGTEHELKVINNSVVEVS